MSNKKKIVYFDMDNVLVNFQSGIDSLDEFTFKNYVNNLDDVPGIFAEMEPHSEMVELFNELADDDRYDCYILSTAPWANPSAWSDKLEWVKKYLPKGYKRLILTHNKNLNAGDYLIDDRTHNGAGEFNGKHIHYGTNEYPDVDSVRNEFI